MCWLKDSIPPQEPLRNVISGRKVSEQAYRQQYVRRLLTQFNTALERFVTKANTQGGVTAQTRWQWLTVTRLSQTVKTAKLAYEQYLDPATLQTLQTALDGMAMNTTKLNCERPRANWEGAECLTKANNLLTMFEKQLPELPPIGPIMPGP